MPSACQYGSKPAAAHSAMSAVGWGDGGTPTNTPRKCWGSYLTPTYGTTALDAPCGLALGDLNGDGKPEAVTANCHSNTASVLINASSP